MTPAELALSLLTAYNTPSFTPLHRNLKPHLSLAVFEALKAEVDRERLRNPQKALHIATLMETLADGLNEASFKAMAWWAKGNCFYHLCRYQDALHYFQQAQSQYQPQTHPLEIVRLQINQVAVLNEIGDHETALHLAEAARQTAHHLGEPVQRYLALLEMNVGWAYYKMGQLQHALTAYNRGRLNLQAVDDVVETARVDVNRAIILEEMNQFDQAQSLLQDAHSVLHAHHCDQEVARVALNAGLLAHRRGQYQNALSHLEAAHSGFTAIENWVEVAVVNLRRAFVYRDLNLLKEMVTLAGQAERIFNEHQMHWQQALALISQGIGYRRLGLFAVADRHLEQARQLLQKQNAHGELLKLALEQASLALAQGNTPRAYTLAEALLPQLDETRYPTLSAQTHLILAQCQLDEAPPTARHHIETALNLARHYHLPETRITAHGWLGHVLEQAGQSAAAWQQYQHAMATVEIMRAWLLLDEFQLGFMAEKRFVYDEALRFSHRLGNPAQILQTLNLVYAAPLSRPLDPPPVPPNSVQAAAQAQLKAELQTSREAWRWLRSKLNTPDDLLSEIWSASAQAKGLDWHHQLAQLESRIADLSHRLELNTPHWPSPANSARSATLQTEASDFLQQVQAQLQPGAVLVHYYQVDDSLHALLLTPTAIHHHLNLVQSATLSRLLKAWQFHLAHGHSLNPPSKRYLQKFYDHLLAPLRPNLPAEGQLWVVVPPQWHHLPLAALYDGQHYAIEKWHFSYLSAVEMLLLPAATPQVKPGERLVAGVIGYSDNQHLPHAIVEAETVAHSLTAHYRTELRLEAAATRAAFERLSQQSHILHLATHAVFRPDNPLFSWLRLADADLTVADIQPLRLPTRPLMVLSACETGRGEARGGGLLGMARGLLAAGASSLIVSLWQLPDQSTATLMQNFYTQLLAAEAGRFTAVQLAQALQAAQKQAIAENHPPRDWAGLAFVYS